MKSGTEKKPNPHEPPLGKFLRSLERRLDLTGKYMRLRSGAVVRVDTWHRMREDRTR